MEESVGNAVVPVTEKKIPIYHRKRLIGYLIVGNTFAVLLMIGTAATVFFPSAAVLLVSDVNPVGVIFISTASMFGKFVLGYGVLMYPVIKLLAHWAAQQNREALTLKDLLKISAVILGSVPITMTFTLGALGSMDFLYNLVSNSTSSNTTQLPDLFFSVANATTIPAVRGVLAGSVAGLNGIGNVMVFLGFAGLFVSLKTEYESIIFNDKLSAAEKEAALLKYKIGVWGGFLVSTGVGVWGNIPYIPYTIELFQRYLFAPEGVGVFMATLSYANMLMLAFFCITLLAKGATEIGVDIVRWNFKEWPETKQVLINIIKGLISIGIVGMGCLDRVFAAIYANLNLPLQIGAGIMGALLEIGGVYLMLGLAEKGLGLIANGLKDCCCPAALAEESDTTESTERYQSPLEKTSDLVSPMDKTWEESTSEVSNGGSPPKITVPTEEAEEKKTVSWGRWFGSFFSCCHRADGKKASPMPKRGSEEPLFSEEVNAASRSEVPVFN